MKLAMSFHRAGERLDAQSLRAQFEADETAHTASIDREQLVQCGFIHFLFNRHVVLLRCCATGDLYAGEYRLVSLSLHS